MKVICIDASGIKFSPPLIEGAIYTVIKKDAGNNWEAFYLAEIPATTIRWGYYSWRFLPCSEIEEGILDFETVQL